MSDRRLPPVEPPAPAATETERVIFVELPNGGSLSYSKTESSLALSTHRSISQEVMMVEVQKATAEVKVAQAQFATPAQERTKQVAIVGGVVIIVALAAFVAMYFIPAAVAGIVAVAGLVSAVFGGAYVVEKLTAPKRLPPPSESVNS